MKRSVLYAAAMMAVTGVMMWHNPMISHAEPVQEEAVQISEVLLVPSEEEVLAQSGPDAEIQKALAEAKAAEEDVYKRQASTCPDSTQIMGVPTCPMKSCPR